MAQPIPLALPPQSNQSEQGHGGVAALINSYVVPNGDEQKSSISIRAAAGLEPALTLNTTGGVRGLIEVDGIVYAVAGRKLYQIEGGAESAAEIGGIPSDGFVGMARNQRGSGVQTIICCDGLSYVCAGGTLTQITDGDLPPAVDVCVINRSAIFCSADGRMARSDIDNASDIDGLDVATAEAVPDGLYRVVDRGADLIAIGSRSAEIWTDTGGDAFGFTRGHVVNVGAVGPRAVTKATILGEAIADTVAWVATNHEGAFSGVVLLNGYQAARIDTAFVNRKIAAETDKTAIIASSWVELGRGMIGFRLSNTTLVFDTSTKLWHERQSRDANGELTAWRVGLTTVLGGRVLAGHAIEASLYWIDPECEDDAGEDMILRVRTPPLNAFPGRLEASMLHLDMAPGTALVSASDTAELTWADSALTWGGEILTWGGLEERKPQVTLRMSRDGKTWSNSRVAGLGAQGDYGKRVYWTRLGTFRQASFEFTCSANIAREIYSASWEGAKLP